VPAAASPCFVTQQHLKGLRTKKTTRRTGEIVRKALPGRRHDRDNAGEDGSVIVADPREGSVGLRLRLRRLANMFQQKP